MHPRISVLVRSVAVAASLALIAAACGGDDAASPAPVEPTGDTSTDDTASPGTTTPSNGTEAPVTPTGPRRLVVGNADEPTLGFYPATSAVGAGGNAIAMGIFDTLTVVDGDGQFVPYLAETIEPNDDNTEWTIVLREGILFADGSALDAAALKDNFDRMDEGGRPIEPGFTSEVVDEMTVVVRFLAPYGPFPAAMSSPYAWIASAEAMGSMSEEEFGDNPIGSGPYIIKEWVRDDHLTLERNPHYWRADEGLPYFDEIEFRPIVEDSARLAALQAGDVDLITVGVSDVARVLERTDEFNVFPVHEGVDAILFNNSIEPFDDVRVRRGLGLALDREALILSAWNGVGELATGPIPNDNPFSNNGDYPSYDPEAARALIEEYEAETGTEVSFTLSFGQGTASAEVAQLAQQYWGDIGVEVELEGPIRAGDFPARVGTHEYEVAVYGVPGFIDPDVWVYILFKSDSFLNIGAMSDPDIDAALDIGHGSSDFEERKAAYAEIQEVLAERMQWFFIRDGVAVVAARPDIVGVDEFPMLDGSVGLAKQGQFYTPFAAEAVRVAGS